MRMAFCPALTPMAETDAKAVSGRAVFRREEWVRAPKAVRGPAPVEPVKQPHNPISLRQVETVVARSVAFFGLVFALQAVPVVLGQLGTQREGFGITLVAAVIGGIVLSVVASLARRRVRTVNGYLAIAYLGAIAVWPLVAINPSLVAHDRPWLWLLCTIATGAAAQAFSVWLATAYLVLAPVVYGIVRMTPSGGGKDPQGALLDVAYVIILGGGLLILITLLRQAAASVDTAQSTALGRYAHAVLQHATEVERVKVDAIVHDSVLTTLISAARALSPEAKGLAAAMARDAMGHLSDAAAISPDDDSRVELSVLSSRIVAAATKLAEPFDVVVRPLSPGSLPAQAAEALYSASIQAMLNSIQHAGAPVRRWISVGPAAHTELPAVAPGDSALPGFGATEFDTFPPVGSSDAENGIAIEVGDSGCGFDLAAVPTERLGVRVSIFERVVSAGGSVAIESAQGEGTRVHIGWPVRR